MAELIITLINYASVVFLVAVVVFLAMNHYINVYRSEELPANKFIPYLICEFYIGTHFCSYDEGTEEMYLICDRCEKVWRTSDEEKTNRESD